MMFSLKSIASNVPRVSPICSRYISSFNRPLLDAKDGRLDDVFDILSDINVLKSLDLNSGKEHVHGDGIASESVFFEHKNSWEGFTNKENIESLVGRMEE
ncbi:hypothetical protein AYI68_g6563 [Smittium mucronatum]|uniref:Uncharacterized protein n=1 Tax=Smittium mucronatum TaxID=133383 RepID=A0A1R0GR62_9FUNG|nr:hypothetical protein AYI68_g6563 [Smittium mucronatum]